MQTMAKPYRIKRFAAFNPWRAARGAGFQLIESFIALGEGGKWGQGLGAEQRRSLICRKRTPISSSRSSPTTLGSSAGWRSSPCSQC